jgi:hypothetical protein
MDPERSTKPLHLSAQSVFPLPSASAAALLLLQHCFFTSVIVHPIDVILLFEILSQIVLMLNARKEKQ